MSKISVGKISITYRAPEGDEPAIIMGGVRFFDRQPLALDPSRHADLIGRARTNPHFAIAEPIVAKATKLRLASANAGAQDGMNGIDPGRGDPGAGATADGQADRPARVAKSGTAAPAKARPVPKSNAGRTGIDGRKKTAIRRKGKKTE